MPRLHKYRNRIAHYVLTAIGGAVITYQLTTEGERKLIQAGIGMGQLFPRALLLDLCKTGDAFTRGSGVDDPALLGAGQLEMDFANDPDPETAFPACGDCRSADELHLVLSGTPGELNAKLQCATCRMKTSAAVDTSIPLALVARASLARLFDLKTVSEKDRSVSQFEELLRTEFASRWEELRRHRGAAQTSLFDERTEGDLI